jgi:zinc protease
MTTYTLTTHVGNVVLTRVTPLSPDIVRFSLTAKIPKGSERFTQSVLALYASLLFTRTKRKSKLALEEYQRQYGIDIDISTGIESISFHGSVRKVHVDKLATLLSELLFEPVVDAKEFVQKKKLAFEANREAHDDAKRIAHVTFVNALYSHEPRLRLDTLAMERLHIKKVTVSHVQTLQRALTTSAWYVTVVGDVATEYTLLPFIKRLAENAVPDERSVISASRIESASHFTTVPSKTNVEVQIGNVGLIRNDDPTFPALDFGINVLGKVGGFSGRLMSTVREKEGLTYGIYAHTNTHHFGDAFHFVIRTFFMAKDYEKGIQSTHRELRSIVEKGITDSELITFKEILKNQYELAHESNKTRLQLYHSLVVRGYNESLYRAYQEDIARLTKKQVHDALRANINPSVLVVSAAGPISKEGKPLITPKG